MCIISLGSSLYFLRYIVTLTRYTSRCGWRWLEKPERLYGARRWLTTSYRSQGIRYTAHWFQNSITLLHMVAIAITTIALWKNISSINQPERCCALARESYSWFYLMLDYAFHVDTDFQYNCDWLLVSLDAAHSFPKYNLREEYRNINLE